MVTTNAGSKLLEDADTITSAKKRIERNSHDHHDGHEHGHGGHGHGHHSSHDGDGVDFLDFFRQVGVRLTDGKDREGADDLGNGRNLFDIKVFEQDFFLKFFGKYCLQE